VRDAMDVDTVVIMLLEEDNDLVAWATKGLELDVRIRVPLALASLAASPSKNRDSDR